MAEVFTYGGIGRALTAMRDSIGHPTGKVLTPVAIMGMAASFSPLQYAL